MRGRGEKIEPPPIEGRVPPHDLDAEAAVLSAVMLDGTALDKVLEFLRPEHFYSEAHRRIFEAALELRGRGQPVDVVQVATWLKDRERIQQVGGMEYLAAILNQAPAIANVAAYGRTIHEKWRVRQLILTCQRVVAQGYIDYGIAQEFIDEAEQSIYTIARTQESSSVERLLEVIKKSFKKLTEALERGDRITGIPTGFERLDRLTAGLHEGDLTIVAARPGMGKTSLVLNLAVNVASSKPTQRLPSESDPGRRWDEQGVGVVVFSLEMPREQIANRMVCCEGRVDVSKVRSGYLGPQEWNKLTQASAFLGSLPVWIDDSPALSILELRAKVRRLQAEFDKLDENGRKLRRVGLVVVDYLQLMRGREGASSREQEISEISRGLKALAKELSVSVIALSQLNRAVETRSEKSKRPQLSDLRECVTGEMLVCLADGRRIPIRDLVGRTPEVLAMSEDGRIVRAASDEVWRVGRKPVFDVVLASGRRIRATARHRMYTNAGWKRVEDIAVGERMACARRLPEPSLCEHWSQHRIALLGLFIGDGSYLRHQPLRITTASDEISELVQRAATEEFGARVSRHEGKGNWHQLVVSGNGNRWNPRGFGRWLKELGIFGQRSHEKRVPEAAFRLHDAQIGLLLRYLWATDGTIHVRKAGSRGGSTVSFATCSRGLADDVAALLLRLGIVARIRRVEQESHRPVFHVAVSGVEAQRIFLERVGAFGPRVGPAKALEATLPKIANTNVDTVPIEVFAHVRKRMRERGITTRAVARLRGTSYGGTSHFRFAPSRTLLAEYATLLGDPALAAQARSDLFWDRVVSIEPAGEEEVFDLTVPGPASWLADGIVSHNSGAIEQDADNIVFIYRDEYYNRETTMEKNIAELIVAKQRNGPTGTIKVRFDNAYTRFDNLAEGEYPDDEPEM